MSDATIPGKPGPSSKGTSLGKLIRGWRCHTASVACLLSFALAVAATIAFAYLSPRADIQSRHPIEIGAAAFAAGAVVLLFRALDGRFAIQSRTGNRQSSSVIGVLLWISCFAILSAASFLLDLRHFY